MNKSWLLFFAILFSGNAWAQKGVPDSLAKKPAWQDWRFLLGFDASRAGMLLAGNQQQITCGRMEISRKKSSFSLETGIGKHQKEFERFRALSSGFYARLGYNRLLINDSDSELGFGFGLANSQYKYTASQILLAGADSLPSSSVSLESMGRSILWSDFSGMIKTRIWRSVWFGFELRLKFLLKGDSDAIPSYFSPGYGIVQNRFLPGFNYFIFVALPGKTSRIVSTPNKNSPR